jgi:hypothetical protein
VISTAARKGWPKADSTEKGPKVKAWAHPLKPASKAAPTRTEAKGGRKEGVLGRIMTWALAGREG